MNLIRHRIILLLMLISVFVVNVKSNPRLNLTEYLESELIAVNRKLYENMTSNTHNYTLNLNNTVPNHNIPYGIYSFSKVIMFFGFPHIFLDDHLYRIGNNRTAKLLKTFSTSTTHLRHHNISFIRNIEYKNLGIILIANNDGFSDIYLYDNITDNIFKMQTIRNKNITDAIFMTKGNNLYLIISTCRLDNLAPTRFFQFNGAHFDEVESVLMRGAMKVHSFQNTNDNALFIMLFQISSSFGKNDGVIVTSVIVYELRNERDLRLIQKSNITGRPIVVSNYYLPSRRELYVVIVDDAGAVTTFLWNGYELQLFRRYIYSRAFQNIILINHDDQTFLVSTLDASLSVSVVTERSINFLFESDMSSSYKNVTNLSFNEENGLLYIFGYNVVNGKNSIIIKSGVLKETTNSKSDLQRDDGKDLLLKCFWNLEQNLYKIRNDLKSARTPMARHNENSDDLNGVLTDINSRLLNMKRAFIKYDVNPDFLTINGTTITKNMVISNNTKLINVDLDSLNERNFQLENFLSKSHPQTIKGPTTLNTIKTKLLFKKDVDNNRDLFNDVLLSKGTQKITGIMNIESLKSSNFSTSSINNISSDAFYYRSKPVKIGGEKVVLKDLHVDNAKIATINKVETAKVLKLFSFPNFEAKYRFSPELKIDSLSVNIINGVDFEEFTDSLFIFGSDLRINGHLTFDNGLESKNMNFQTLSRKRRFLTTTTDQEISSSIFINRIFSKSIVSNITNGIKNFGKSVVTTADDESLIDGPLKINHMKIKKDLEMSADDIDESKFLSHNEHIMGTNESDFIQEYQKYVKINGNLHLRSLNIKNVSWLKVSDKNITGNFQEFWSKSLDQVIPTHFEVQNGLSTSHLFVKLINEIDVKNFMINTFDYSRQESTKYYFENAIINGSLNLNSHENHSPNIREIWEGSVKINDGQPQHIKGRKKFIGDLKIEKLEHGTNLDASSLFIRNLNSRVLLVKGDFRTNLSTDNINSANVSQLAQNTLYIEDLKRNVYIPELRFKYLSVTHLKILNYSDNVNNITEYLSKFDRVKTLQFINELSVKNNMKAVHITNVSHINDVSLHDLMANNNMNQTDISAGGTKIKFVGHLNIQNLRVVVINDFNFTTLTRRVLYKKFHQKFTNAVSFHSLISDQLFADTVNNMSLKNLVDISNFEEQTILVPNSLKIIQASVINALDVNNLLCNLREALHCLQNPQPQFWENIIVNGNVNLLDTESPVKEIFQKALTVDDGNNLVVTRTISGPVTFVKHISTNLITTLNNINDIDVQAIIDDALLINSEVEQVVTGHKIFQFVSGAAKSLDTDNTIVTKNSIKVGKINNINLKELDANILTQNNQNVYRINGKKILFGGLQATKIETDVISHVMPENLVSTSNLTKIPNVIFESIDVFDNLFLKFVNGIDIKEFFNARFLIRRDTHEGEAKGKYIFLNVKIDGNISALHINNIKANNIVFDDNIQTLTSPKTFLNDVNVGGNVIVELVNGLRMSEAYADSVVPEDTIFNNGDIRILRPSEVTGYITTRFINNVSFVDLIETIKNEPLKIEQVKIKELTSIISKIIYKFFNLTINVPSEYMYLEKSSDLQISVSETIGAQVVETRNDVLIHIAGEEPGSFCGLSNRSCKCPVQQTIQISAENSINMFSNKGNQRIFTYADDRVIVHLITNSISVNSKCRTNRTKVLQEISYITWNTVGATSKGPKIAPQPTAPGGFFMHDKYLSGFISRAEFFTLFDSVYIVVGRYYDPVLDSHSLECSVFKFNKDMTELKEIQRIPSEAVWTMTLIHTAHGVVLIMGSGTNRATTNEEVVDADGITTKILRFNSHSDQFELMREVPNFGASSAVGVVLGLDSLLVLADKHSNLYIFKYSRIYDNYFIYQSFQLDDPIYSLSVFYSDRFGISDAYLAVVTKYNKYYVYSYEFIEGWKLMSIGEIEGIKGLIPFRLNKKSYLFAPSSKMSSLLTLVEHDSN